MDNDELLMLNALQVLLLIDIANKLEIQSGYAQFGGEMAKRIIERITKPEEKAQEIANEITAAYNPKLDHPAGVVGASGTDVRSTVPSLAELNKPDFTPGTDPL